MLRSFLAVTAILSLWLNQGENKRFENRFFPQHVGDEWTYRKTGRLAQEGAGWTNKIVGNEKSSFKHSNYWGDNKGRLIRINKRGEVLEKTHSGPSLWYKLADDAQGEWVLKLGAEGPPCVTDSRIKVVSGKETVEVPAGKFENCLKLEFSTNCNDAGVYQQWFAPGIGLIRQTEETIAGPLISELVSAKIDGVVYPRK